MLDYGYLAHSNLYNKRNEERKAENRRKFFRERTASYEKNYQNRLGSAINSTVWMKNKDRLFIEENKNNAKNRFFMERRKAWCRSTPDGPKCGSRDSALWLAINGKFNVRKHFTNPKIEPRKRFFQDREDSYNRACTMCNFWKSNQNGGKGPGVAISMASWSRGRKLWYFGKLP